MLLAGLAERYRGLSLPAEEDMRHSLLRAAQRPEADARSA